MIPLTFKSSLVRLDFLRESQSIIESVEGFGIPANFVNGKVDHLGKVKFGNAYDLRQGDAK
jgi:hypothetical protein